jgi:hypothetical protein
MSNDLTRWTPAMAEVLLNKEMVAIDQDPLGVSGRLVWNSSEGCVVRQFVIVPCFSLFLCTMIRFSPLLCT